jgi:hypothetical protein
MSKDPDAFFWEQESGLLVKENRNDEAMDLFRRRIINDSDVVSSSQYTINFFLNLLTDKASLGKVKAVIDRLSSKKISKADQADLMYCRILYYKRIDDKKTAKQTGRDAINFYRANKIDAGKLNQLLTGL